MIKGYLFNSKIKETLKQDEWFAAMPFKKQRLLTKYAQSIMFQKKTLSSLKETHSVNLDLANSAKIGQIASMLKDMNFDNHEYDLDFVWETFQKTEKDMSGGLTTGMLLENFVIASQKIDHF